MNGDLTQFAYEPGFGRVMGIMALTALGLAIAMVAVVFTYYVRSDDADARSDPWDMLFATWRDSLLITVLFVGQSLLYRYSEFSGLQQIGAQNVAVSVSYLIQPMLSLVADILIFVVAILRVIALTRWLAARQR